jgi:glycolate oxidase FAD binding subunit
MTLTTLKPETAEQAAETVRWALAAGETLDVAGTSSKRGLGRPMQTAYTLDLSDLSGIVDYAPEELVLTAKAGTPIAEVRALLKSRRQQLAFEPQDLGALFGGMPDQGTLGGTLACGLAGPRRISAGSARDHALGFEGINGRGELYKAGGRVVKNVTGYDVPKLLVGSFGTLTVLTEISIKVLPAPEETATLVLTGLDNNEAIAALTKAMQSPYDVTGAAHLPAAIAARSRVGAIAAAGTAATLVRLEGFAPSVVARVAALKDELQSTDVLDCDASLALWAEIRDVAVFAGDQQRHIWKISVPPSEAAHIAQAIQAELAAELYFDWGGGLIWVATHPDAEAAALRAALGLYGHATLIRAPDNIRATRDVFQPLAAPVMALSRRVKESFDPRGILSPGRMYAGV